MQFPAWLRALGYVAAFLFFFIFAAEVFAMWCLPDYPYAQVGVAYS